MQYAWLTLEPSGDQQAGFFVDEDDRILYWPTEDSPGFVVDLETFDKLSNFLSNFQSRVQKFAGYGVGAILAIGSVLFWFSGSVFPLVDQIFSEGAFPVILVVLFVSIYIALVLVFARYANDRAVKRALSILEGAERLEMPSPKPQRLKPSAMDGKALVWLGMPVLALVGTGIIVMPFAGSEMIGDRIFFCLMGLLIVALSVSMLWLERTGLRIDQVRLYKWPHNEL